MTAGISNENFKEMLVKISEIFAKNVIQGKIPYIRTAAQFFPLNSRLKAERQKDVMEYQQSY